MHCYSDIPDGKEGFQKDLRNFRAEAAFIIGTGHTPCLYILDCYALLQEQVKKIIVHPNCYTSVKQDFGIQKQDLCRQTCRYITLCKFHRF